MEWGEDADLRIFRTWRICRIAHALPASQISSVGANNIPATGRLRPDWLYSWEWIMVLVTSRLGIFWKILIYNNLREWHRCSKCMANLFFIISGWRIVWRTCQRLFGHCLFLWIYHWNVLDARWLQRLIGFCSNFSISYRWNDIFELPSASISRNHFSWESFGIFAIFRKFGAFRNFFCLQNTANKLRVFLVGLYIVLTCIVLISLFMRNWSKLL